MGVGVYPFVEGSSLGQHRFGVGLIGREIASRRVIIGGGRSASATLYFIRSMLKLRFRRAKDDDAFKLSGKADLSVQLFQLVCAVS